MWIEWFMNNSSLVYTSLTQVWICIEFLLRHGFDHPGIKALRKTPHTIYAWPLLGSWISCTMFFLTFNASSRETLFLCPFSASAVGIEPWILPAFTIGIALISACIYLAVLFLDIYFTFLPFFSPPLPSWTVYWWVKDKKIFLCRLQFLWQLAYISSMRKQRAWPGPALLGMFMN